MNIFPIEQIALQSDVIPLLVASMSQNQVAFFGLTMPNAKVAFLENDIDGIVSNLPDLGTSSAFVFFATGFENQGAKVLEFATAVQVEGENAFIEDLDLQIYSQDLPQGDQTFPLTWNPLLADHCPDTLLEALKTIEGPLTQLQSIAQSFTGQ